MPGHKAGVSFARSLVDERLVDERVVSLVVGELDLVDDRRRHREEELFEQARQRGKGELRWKWEFGDGKRQRRRDVACLSDDPEEQVEIGLRACLVVRCSLRASSPTIQPSCMQHGCHFQAGCPLQAILRQRGNAATNGARRVRQWKKISSGER